MGGWVGTDRRALLGSPQSGPGRECPQQRRGVLFCSARRVWPVCMWARWQRWSVSSSQRCDSPARFSALQVASCSRLHELELACRCDTPPWWRSPCEAVSVWLALCRSLLAATVRTGAAVRQEWGDDILISATPGLASKTSVFSELHVQSYCSQMVGTHLALRSETAKPERQQAPSTLHPCLG